MASDLGPIEEDLEQLEKLPANIQPDECGNCSQDKCQSYDGKRCRITGFRSYGCEPAYQRMKDVRSRLIAEVRRLRASPPSSAAPSKLAGTVYRECPLCGLSTGALSENMPRGLFRWIEDVLRTLSRMKIEGKLSAQGEIELEIARAAIRSIETAQRRGALSPTPAPSPDGGREGK